MTENLERMPPFLKVITASTLAPLAFITASLLPGGSVNVFGHPISPRQWWTSGAGLVILVASFPLIVSGVLMLKRVRAGAVLYVIAMGALSGTIPLVSHLTGATSRVGSWNVTVANIAVDVALGGYLFMSPAVREYFRASD